MRLKARLVFFGRCTVEPLREQALGVGILHTLSARNDHGLVRCSRAHRFEFSASQHHGLYKFRIAFNRSTSGTPKALELGRPPGRRNAEECVRPKSRNDATSHLHLAQSLVMLEAVARRIGSS